MALPDQKNGNPSRLDGLVRRAQWVLAFEGLWPPLVLAAALMAMFVAVSWLGLWIAVPAVFRILGVGCLSFGLAVAALAAYRATRPDRAGALARLDRDSGLPHRPISTAEDQLANQGHDPITRALWELHRKRLEAAVARVRVSAPSPRTADRDPFALRALALLLLVMAAFVAGPDKEGLVGAAFDWRSGRHASAPAFRVDAWVDPPAYTGKPPVVLFAPDQAGQPPRDVRVPVHSILVVRSSGQGSLDLTVEGALKAVEPPATAGAAMPRSPDDRGAGPSTPPVAKPDANERRFLLTGKARLTVGHDGERLAAVALQAIPDLPPTITPLGQLKATARGGLSLDYKIDDDYGVVGADASFSDPFVDGKPLTGRSLVPAPRLALSLPPGPGGLGTGQTTGDLSDHPWAGAEVSMVLSAKDEGGNVGLSAPVRVRLPARSFTKPLARALVEQRRDLVLDPDHRDAIGVALDALMIAPDEFGTTAAVYLGLYTARQRLDSARTDEDLVGLADYLWQMALRIEDGDLSQAQRDLRAAEQALRDALARGASPEEIKRLTDALREQTSKYLAEMMKQDQGQQQEGRADPNTKFVTPKDIQRMLQRMEEAARSGDTAEAQRMLDQLQNLLENLKSARNGAANQAARDLNRQMSELDRMTRDQQAVRDKTYKQGKQARRSRQGLDNPLGEPQAGQGGDADEDNPDTGDDQSTAGADRPAPDQPAVDPQASQDLQNQQQALRQRLGALRKRLRDLGMKGEKGLDDADSAMKEAEGAMSEGPPGNRRAVDAQGRALQGLQQGASGLAQQMAQGQGDQPGDGQGQGDGQTGQAGANGDTDPLGRQRDGHGMMETRGSEIGQGVAERAQRVLQELRRRLGDPNRPQEEQDYLERLLKRY